MVAWALVVYGVTLVVTSSKAGAPLRALVARSPLGHEFIHCPMCVGWWVGLGVARLFPELAPVAHGWLGAVASAFAACAVAAIATAAMHALAAARAPRPGLTTSNGKVFAPPPTSRCAGCGE